MAKKPLTIVEQVEGLVERARDESEALRVQVESVDQQIMALQNRSIQLAGEREKTENIIDGLESTLAGSR